MAEFLGSRHCGEKRPGVWKQILWRHEKDLIPFFEIHDYIWAHCEYEEGEWKLFTNGPYVEKNYLYFVTKLLNCLTDYC